jgi:hypothetical protein
MTRDDFQALAWADFLRFAIHSKEIRDAFARETGRRIFSAASPLEAMIDDVAGKDGDDVMAFTIWVTRTQWGWDEAPASFRKDAEEWEARQPR